MFIKVLTIKSKICELLSHLHVNQLELPSYVEYKSSLWNIEVPMTG